MINIKDLDKAELLAALYNGTMAVGMGVFHSLNRDMTKEEAQEWIDGMDDLGMPVWFDYVKGRPLKVNISGDELNPDLYDRDAGEGMAALVVEKLRASKSK